MTQKLSSGLKTLKVLDGLLRGLGISRNYVTKKRLPLLDSAVDVDENTIFFDSFYGSKIDCNPLAVFRVFADRFPQGRYRYVWVQEEGAPTPLDVASHPDVEFVRHNSFDHKIALRQAKYIVQNNNLPADFAAHADQIILCTWHGIPIKALGRDYFTTLAGLYNAHRSFNASDIILSSGDFYTNAAIHCNMAPLNPAAVQPIGFPRLDVLYKEALADGRQEDAKPILLYAPTWRGSLNKIDQEVEDQIEVCRMLNNKLNDKYDVYANLHHLVTRDFDLAQLGVKTIPIDQDTNAFLAKVALLVTDYSSIAIDYLVLDRPAILHVPDLEAYRQERGFALDISELPFHISTDHDTLIEAASEPRKPSSFANFDAARLKLLGNASGKSAEQAVDLMLDARQSEPKRLRYRILVFGGAFQLNGITTSLVNLTRLVDHDRIEFCLVVRPDDIDKSADARALFDQIDPRTRVLLWKSGYLPRRERELFARKSKAPADRRRKAVFDHLRSRFEVIARRHWRSTEFDAAIAFTGYSASNAFCALASNARRKAIFLHNDMGAEHAAKGTLNWAVRESYRVFDKVVSVSPGLMAVNGAALRQDIPQQAECFCRNTLDFERLKERAMAPCSIVDEMNRLRADQPDTKIFIHLGRFSIEKNHRRLLDAFQEVRKTLPHAHLWMLGQGPDYNDVVEYAASLQLGKFCHFAGWVQNAAPALKAADAFVLSSDHEGQPMVLLEAMTLGVPCVAVDILPVRYVLEDGYGLLTPPNAQNLAKGMLQVVDTDFTTKPFDPKAYNQEALEDFYKVIGLTAT